MYLLQFRIKLFAFLVFASVTLKAQSGFEEHNRNFNQLLTTDVEKAEKELELQSAELKSNFDSVKYTHNRVSFYLKKNDVVSAESWLEQSRSITPATALNLKAEEISLQATVFFRKSAYRDVINLIAPLQKNSVYVDPFYQSGLSLKMASAYFRLGNTDSASWFATWSLEKSKNLKGIESAHTRSSIFTLKGEINLFAGQYDSAYFYHLNALHVNKQNGDLFGIASSTSSIAGIFLFQEDYRKSLEYYQQALPVYAQIGTTPYDVYNNMGTIYSKLKATDSAFFYYRLAYRGAIEKGRLDLQANAAGGMGELYGQIGEFDSSVVYFRQAQTIFEKFGYPYGIILCKLGIADSYLELGKPDSAAPYVEESLSMLDLVNSAEISKQCYELAFLLKKEQGQFEEALIMNERYLQINDSISGETVKKSIAEMEIKYQTHIKKLENEGLKEHIELQNQRQRYERVLFGLAGVILLSGITVLAFIFRNQKRKLRIRSLESERVRLQNEILTTKLNAAKEAIIQKNATLESLQQSVFQQPLDHEELSKRLLERINDSKEWAAFMIEFNLLYPSFYERLQELTSVALTKSELRMAALIRLNLTNKEISDLLNVSLEAVKKAKYRLAKKLKASDDTHAINLVSML